MSDSECGRNDHTKCIVAKQSVVIGKFCGFLLVCLLKLMWIWVQLYLFGFFENESTTTKKISQKRNV